MMRQPLSSLGTFWWHRARRSFHPSFVLWTTLTLGGFGFLANCASAPSGPLDDEQGGAGGSETGQAGDPALIKRRTTTNGGQGNNCSSPYGCASGAGGVGGRAGGPSYGYGGYGGDGGQGGEPGEIIVRPHAQEARAGAGTASAEEVLARPMGTRAACRGTALRARAARPLLPSRRRTRGPMALPAAAPTIKPFIFMTAALVP